MVALAPFSLGVASVGFATIHAPDEVDDSDIAMLEKPPTSHWAVLQLLSKLFPNREGSVVSRTRHGRAATAATADMPRCIRNDCDGGVSYPGRTIGAVGGDDGDGVVRRLAEVAVLVPGSVVLDLVLVAHSNAMLGPCGPCGA